MESFYNGGRATKPCGQATCSHVLSPVRWSARGGCRAQIDANGVAMEQGRRHWVTSAVSHLTPSGGLSEPIVPGCKGTAGVLMANTQACCWGTGQLPRRLQPKPPRCHSHSDPRAKLPEQRQHCISRST